MKCPRLFRKAHASDPSGSEPLDLIDLVRSFLISSVLFISTFNKEVIAGDTTEVLAHDATAGDDNLLEAAAYARTMSAAEVETVINRIVNEHDNDPNFPTRVLNDAKFVIRVLLMLLRLFINSIATSRYLFDAKLKEEQPAEYQRLYDKLKVEAALITINSPYAEVRAVVDNHDDPWIPVSTFRAWTIGTVLVVAGGFVNQFFSIRYPAIGVGSNVAQILAVPLAKLMEFLPTTEFVAFGYAWSLNPGPFNPKEHVLITIMANVGFITPYTFQQCEFSSVDHKMPKNITYADYLDTISAALLRPGGSLALLSFPSDLTVSPVMDNQLWLSKPGNLATIALNRAFHADKPNVADGCYVGSFTASLPCSSTSGSRSAHSNLHHEDTPHSSISSVICSALSYFNWMTWISPMNVSLAAITGNFGLGFNPLQTFDWNQITIGGDPLINPFFAGEFIFYLGLTLTIFSYHLQPLPRGVFAGLITFPIIVAIWYTNTWNTGYLPINSNLVFDNTGNLYAVGGSGGH
ncbi:OPT-domain-containing protein [Mycena sanguinolenta]|uniref:OPT-domain-containing protein n=1 Tax=Mycena sanguinolenta TaxID=230812 RepID=A0A8H6ZAD5_9AGAR|nr:OPT-domain-containing protein [Mycena sanguinolenta]